jgi:3-oxoacyl-[acyl-carrier protein] reductase
LRRLGEASEIASAAVFIVENDFFTGRCIDVDGVAADAAGVGHQ